MGGESCPAVRQVGRTDGRPRAAFAARGRFRGVLEKRANRPALDAQPDHAASAVDLLNRLGRNEATAAREKPRANREGIRSVARAPVHGALDPADDPSSCVRDEIADRLAKVREHRDNLAHGENVLVTCQRFGLPPVNTL